MASVAARAGVDPDGLAATVAAYNAAAATQGAAIPGTANPSVADPGVDSDDPAGKPADLVCPQDQPPYSLIDFGIRPRLMYPAPVLTLGGLVVDPETGRVLRADGTQIPGLYAAGRSAVGLCSHSYVSGLSIADCVFSGRRAGRNAATAHPVSYRR